MVGGLQNRNAFSAVDALKELMARHNNDQRIHGPKALALPESTTQSVPVNMDAQDQRFYKEDKKDVTSSSLQNMRFSGAEVDRFHLQISYKLFNVPSGSKARALLIDSTRKTFESKTPTCELLFSLNT